MQTSQPTSRAVAEPINTTASVVCEPVLTDGGFVVCIKYKYNININMLNIPSYHAPVTYKVISAILTTEEEVQKFMGEKILWIHQNYLGAKVASVDITNKLK